MVQKAHKWAHKKSGIYRRMIRVFKEFTLPGFQGVRIYTVLSFFLGEFKSRDITTRASAISFNLFLALFPATIFFFTLIAYIPVANFQEEIFKLIKSVTPSNAFEVIQTTLADILLKRQGGLLSLGFLLALYFSTTGINSMIDAFNEYTHSIQPRKALKQQLISLGLTMYATMLIVLNIVLHLAGGWVLDFLHERNLFGDSLEYYLLQGIKWLLTILFIYCLISGMFFYGPSKKRRWPFFSAGSTLATVLSMLATYGFIFYVNNFNSYNKLYGSIGTLVVVMLLIYINCMVMLVGFELNVSIDRALSHHVAPENLTPKDIEPPKT